MQHRALSLDIAFALRCCEARAGPRLWFPIKPVRVSGRRCPRRRQCL